MSGVPLGASCQAKYSKGLGLLSEQHHCAYTERQSESQKEKYKETETKKNIIC